MDEFRAIKVEASAGSGKTYRLTLEYLKRLYKTFLLSGKKLDSRVLNSILAITFTKKAANEMKERILKRLKAFSLAKSKSELSDDDKKFLKTLSEISEISEKEILKSAESLMELILSSFTDFNVKTIDSLMSSIVKVLASELELDPEFEIRVNSSEELEDKILSFTEKLARDCWDEIENFLLDLFKIENLETWSPQNKIIERIKGLYNLSIKRDIEGILSTDVEKIAENLFKKIEVFKSLLGGNGGLLELLEEGFEGKYFNGTRVRDSLKEKITDFLSDEKSVNKVETLVSIAFFKYENPEVIFSSKRSTPEFKARFTPVYKKAKKPIPEIIKLLSIYKISNFIKFFSDFHKFWDTSKKNIYVEEFSKKIRDKLTEWKEFAPPFLYLRLSEKFYHFLIDEFQDTSELQFKALSPLIDEVFAGEENSSLFIVGDRKQAIYRWRGGSSELMNNENLLDELPSLKNIKEKNLDDTLEYNFRSGKEIVKFNNEFFSQDNLSAIVNNPEAVELVVENFKNAEQKPVIENDGYVRVEFIDDADDPDESYFDSIRKSIKLALDAGFKHSEIAILVRKNDEGRDIIENLSDEYDFFSDESLFLSSSQKISEIISFFKFIEYPPDNLSFFTFINGEIFKKSAKKVSEEEAGKLFSGIEDFYLDNKDKRIYTVFRDEFPYLWKNLIAPFFKSVGFLPPYDIFQDFTMIYELYDNFPDEAPFFATFSELLHELEDKGFSSVASFLERWEEDQGDESISKTSVPLEEAYGKIKILTMHKSKGLEFPVVILPLKEKSRSDGGRDSKFYLGKNIHYIKKDFATINNELKELYIDEIKRGYVDELNILYVAMTRAKDALFVPIIIAKNDKPKKSEYEKFRGFAAAFKNHPIFKDWEKKKIFEWGILKSDEEESEKAESEYFKYASKKIITREWQKDFLVFSPSQILLPEDRKLIDRGKRIHRVLEKIEKVKDSEEMEILLKVYAEAEGLNNDDIESLKRFFMRDEILNFYTGEFEVFNEKELLKKTDDSFEIKRVDRLIVGDDEFIVIDYKAGEEKSDEHLEQVREYLSILKEFYSEKTAKGFLFYIEKGEIEEVKL